MLRRMRPQQRAPKIWSKPRDSENAAIWCCNVWFHTDYQEMDQIVLLKMKLMLNGWFNKEHQEMKKIVLLKMKLMLNIPFLPVFTNTAAIPTIKSEWLDNGKTLIFRQYPLLLSWAHIINRSQGKTLDLVIIYLGKSEKCSGMTFFALSCVRKLSRLKNWNF